MFYTCDNDYSLLAYGILSESVSIGYVTYRFMSSRADVCNRVRHILGDFSEYVSWCVNNL